MRAREFVVQGVVTPDEWTVFKPTLATGHPAIVGRRLGTKERSRFCLADDDVLTLGRWACAIEDHYSARAGQPRPMDSGPESSTTSSGSPKLTPPG